MTITVQSTDLITSGTAFTFAAAGDTFWLRDGVALVSTGSRGVNGTTGNLTVIIDGDILAAAEGVRLTGGNDKLIIGDTGSVVSVQDTSSLWNILLDGGTSVLQNYGLISAPGAAAIVLQDGDNSVQNHGEIYGGSLGVYMNRFSDGDKLVNTGIISAGSEGTASPIFRNAILVDGGYSTIINSGSLIAVAGDGSGISINSNSNSLSVLRNSGEITSADWYAVDATRTSSPTATVDLHNTGLISGDEGSYRGSNGFDTVINRGLMIGDIDMGGGSDLYYGKWGSVDGTILLGDGDDTASGGAEDERIEGGFGIDRIFGFGGDDNLFGDSGNDILRGGDGDDGLNGGIGNDDLGGGAGDDVLLGADGNDLLRGDDGADVMHGGSGYDRASYRDSKEGITLDLADTSQSTGFAEGDSYVSIEAYEATNFNDIMFGDDVNNLLRGYDGDDQISGRGGNDNLQGFDGDDILSGGTGNDTLNGGDGTDVAAFTGDLADYTFTLLGNGNIRVEDTVGSDGIDVLVVVEFVTFGGGAEIDVTGLI